MGGTSKKVRYKKQKKSGWDQKMELQAFKKALQSSLFFDHMKIHDALNCNM